MEASLRHRLGPMAGFVTLAVGVGIVAVAGAVSSMFPTPHTVEREAPVDNNDKYDFFSAPRVEVKSAPAKTEFSCYDLNILPIWNELKKDKEFRDRTSDSGEVLDCSTLLEVKSVDLNRDRNNEFLVRGKDVPLCGGTGNCLFWIFEKRRSRMIVLLAASDYVDMAEMGDQVLESRTLGYSDILLKGHFTAAETGYYTHRFDGRRYVDSRCMYEVPNHHRRKEGSMEMITCEEFERRIERELSASESKR